MAARKAPKNTKPPASGPVQPSPSQGASAATSVGRAVAATLLAWLVPGAGHALLGRRGRALAFFAIVMIALAIGWQLDGELSHQLRGHPLEVLRTLGCLGLGLIYFVLHSGLGYAGHLEAPGFEYGSTFLLTAGLMNYLLVLDAWDIARGDKP